jgi:hypothetical protein
VARGPRVDPDPPVLRCATCGRVLGGDPEDEPRGDAGRPICGECDRARDFEVLDAADGEQDDRIDA